MRIESNAPVGLGYHCTYKKKEIDERRNKHFSDDSSLVLPLKLKTNYTEIPDLNVRDKKKKNMK